MSVVLGCSRLCIKQWMFVHDLTNLEWNHYHGWYSVHINHDLKLIFGWNSMYIHISGWHMFGLGTVSFIIGTGQNRCHSWQRLCRIWCQHSGLAWWMFTCSIEPSVCVWILCCAIWAMKAAVSVIVTNHSWVSFYCSLGISMHRKLISPRLLLLDSGIRFPHQVLRLLYCSVRTPSFSHFGQI